MRTTVLFGLVFGIVAAAGEAFMRSPMPFPVGPIPTFIIGLIAIALSGGGLLRADVRAMALAGVVLGLVPFMLLGADLALERMS